MLTTRLPVAINRCKGACCGYNPVLVLDRTTLKTKVKGVDVEIELEGFNERAYANVSTTLHSRLSNPAVKNRDAIKEAYLEVLNCCPAANASDVWHHVIYRRYCEILPQLRHQNASQSWVRASGEALETVVEELYKRQLAPHGIEIKALISGPEKKKALTEMKLSESAGGSKLDVALYVRCGENKAIFGGVHVKASLAERVSDDIPTSLLMMERSYFSPLWTLDVKSFPLPHGDLVNRGELGSPQNPSDKRKYIEDHGSFDNAYTANSRSVASAGATASGKRIVRVDIANQPDAFVVETVARAQAFKKVKRVTNCR